ncbi:MULTISPECIES: hypothetical protein [Providencia]|uniref:Phage tail protein C-terminal domain-containing protein n=1 Tax=Providencia stuartii TaxID=588 RepID=A0ABD5L2Y3_PROST
MYNVGTVTTTANSTKLIGVGTKWKENINLVLPMQMIQIQIGNTVHNNSIHSIQSNTELTLNFPIPTAQTGAKYVIFTTTMDSISAAANAIVAMNSSNVQFSDIQNRIMTESGVIDVKLPDGTVRKTRTEAERDKQLDGKFDKTGGTINGSITATGTIQAQGGELTVPTANGAAVQLNSKSEIAKIRTRDKNGSWYDHIIPDSAGTFMQVGDYGIGTSANLPAPIIPENPISTVTMFFQSDAAKLPFPVNEHVGGWSVNRGSRPVLFYFGNRAELNAVHYGGGGWSKSVSFYSTANTTKDSNGNLKAASPIVKLFADHIETNDESEGVEMEHLGVGHYLIKGVVGFNADGAWGINNGFVIPQDHNGKNMVLIDYKVRPDGDIEVFVFHQQNADMPERFQNKRIKYIDKDGNPVYYENYEPCDVPESRWIDMRVEMPPNSIYNLKQAEAERLAKEEAERQAEEEAKNAEIEAEEDI